MEYREITNIVLLVVAAIILGIIIYRHIKTPRVERSVEWKDKIIFLHILFYFILTVFLIKNNVIISIGFATF